MYLNYKAIIATLTVGMAFLSHSSSFAGATETSKLRRASVEEDAVSSGWIVVLNKETNLTDTRNYQKNLQGEFVRTKEQLQVLASAYGGKVDFVYKEALYGMAVTMEEDDAARMAQDPSVKYIEQDTVVSLKQQTSATWGIDRIDQRDLPLDSTYYPGTADGTGVTAYVIDSGVLITHNEFKNANGQSRAVWGINTTGDNRDEDCRGHGTHVAGTVGGLQYGVAKNVNIVAVKVLNCSGSGSWAGIITGLEWVLNDASAKGILGNAVANMSLGGGVNQSVNDAAANLHKSGVITAVSAGNDSANACNKSPASEPTVITVGSTTGRDSRSVFSNFGTCLDIFAPGSSITSAYIGSNSATDVKSGTSMSSPHVAGALAILLSSGNSLDAESDLINEATRDKVSDAGTGSPNIFLYIKDILMGPVPSSSPSISPVPTVSLVPSVPPSKSPSPTIMPTRVPSVPPSKSPSPTIMPTRVPSGSPTITSMPSPESNSIPISIYSNRYPDYCLAGKDSDSELYLRPCSLPSTVMFYATPQGYIRSADDGKCLEANSSPVNNARPQFKVCNKSINQRWRIESSASGGSTIKPEIHYPNVCLDENSTNNNVYQWNCDTTPDQYFNLGPLATNAPSSTSPSGNSPSGAPVVTSSISPSENSPSGAPVVTCVDSTLNFRFEKPLGGFISKYKDCSWVGSNKEKQCGVKANRISCPETCSKCHVCKDSPLKFKIEKKNKTLKTDCKWVKENKAARCKSAAVVNACRDTCKAC